MPVHITLGDKEYSDARDISQEEFYKFLKENPVLPRTSAYNPAEATEFFEEQLKSDGGYDAFVKALRKSIKPERKHIFSRWIEYEGLQPQPTDYKMVNDYIEQSFDILRQETNVSIMLRDILVMSEPV